MESTTTYLVLKELAGNPAPHYNAIQTLFAPHVSTIAHLWVAVWILTAIVIGIQLWYEYKNGPRD